MDWNVPNLDAPVYSLEGEVNTATTGTTVSSGIISNNTKSAWTQILASTPFEASGIWIDLLGTGSVRPYLIDIGIGGSGAEQVLIPNLFYVPTVGAVDRAMPSYFFPIGIRSGARLSARIQAAVTSVSRDIYVAIRLASMSFGATPPLSRVTAYGALTATTRGTTVDPGGTADTMVYTQIDAAIANKAKQMLLSVWPSNANTAMTDCKWRCNIARGAAASERVRVEGIPLCASTAGDQVVPTINGPFPVDMAAGQRLALGAQCSIVDATDRLLEAVLYGVD
jgi:hypothetical protein